MTDRQDIDALLVSALYGELTPAEEARLNAHLESHPGDRAVLDGMTRARQALHESRILTAQLDPPQSVSAMLLQEAARRAPAKPSEAREGWFARFVHSFASRPAMAAAAMLVLVLGVFGTLKLAGRGNDLVNEQASTESAAGERTAASPTGAAGEAPPAVAGPTHGSAYAVTLADDDSVKADLAEAKLEAAKRGADKGQSDQKEKAADSRKQINQRPEPAVIATDRQLQTGDGFAMENSAAKNRRDGLTVEQAAPRPQRPMDLDDSRRRPPADPAPDTAKTEADAEGLAGAGGVGGAVPPPPSAPATAPTTAPRATARGGGGEENRLPPEDIAAAQRSRDELLVAVRANDCDKAARLAIELESRAPNFFRQQVETDRELKKCISHVNAERERQQRVARPGRAAAPQPAAPPKSDKAASEKRATDSKK